MWRRAWGTRVKKVPRGGAVTPKGFAQVLQPPNPYQKLQMAYTTSADRVGWKHFGQLQVTSY